MLVKFKPCANLGAKENEFLLESIV